MTRRPWRLVLAMAAILLLLFGSAQADIPVQLRFDGQPLEPAAKRDVTCFKSTLDRGVTCHVQKIPGTRYYRDVRQQRAEVARPGGEGMAAPAWPVSRRSGPGAGKKASSAEAGGS